MPSVPQQQPTLEPTTSPERDAHVITTAENHTSRQWLPPSRRTPPNPTSPPAPPPPTGHPPTLPVHVPSRQHKARKEVGDGSHRARDAQQPKQEPHAHTIGLAHPVEGGQNFILWGEGNPRYGGGAPRTRTERRPAREERASATKARQKKKNSNGPAQANKPQQGKQPPPYRAATRIAGVGTPVDTPGRPRRPIGDGADRRKTHRLPWLVLQKQPPPQR